jgi:hypothetical protein
LVTGDSQVVAESIAIRPNATSPIIRIFRSAEDDLEKILLMNLLLKTH